VSLGVAPQPAWQGPLSTQMPASPAGPNNPHGRPLVENELANRTRSIWPGWRALPEGSLGRRYADQLQRQD